MWEEGGEVRGGEARGGVRLGVEVEAWMAPALVRVLGQQGGWGSRGAGGEQGGWG